MILTVTTNPAIDVTYRLSALRPGDVHRVTSVEERAGGKGLNVARVLRALGVDVVAAALAGGPDADRLERELEAEGIGTAFVDGARVRRTLVIVAEDGTTTSLWEPGHGTTDPLGSASRLTARVDGLLASARALVVSGSLPPDLDPRLPARLARLAVEGGTPVVVDVDGEALDHAVRAGGAVVAPNRDELGELLGSDLRDRADVRDAAAELCRRGARGVLATCGPEGALLQLDSRAWWARPAQLASGNPTGAGDAAAAALARGLADGIPPQELLRAAVALSAAAVQRPVAGEVDLEAWHRWHPEVEVEELPPDKAPRSPQAVADRTSRP